MHGKSGNFRGIHSSKWQNRRKILRSFPVISGRFQSFSVIFGRFSGHFRSFLVMIPNDSAKSFLFFPFHSSTPCFYALQHKIFIFSKISRFFFGGSKFSSYLCQRLTDDCRQSGRATVSPMAFSRRLFLCLGKSFF